MAKSNAPILAKIYEYQKKHKGVNYAIAGKSIFAAKNFLCVLNTDTLSYEEVKQSGLVYKPVSNISRCGFSAAWSASRLPIWKKCVWQPSPLDEIDYNWVEVCIDTLLLQAMSDYPHYFLGNAFVDSPFPFIVDREALQTALSILPDARQFVVRDKGIVYLVLLQGLENCVVLTCIQEDYYGVWFATEHLQAARAKTNLLQMQTEKKTVTLPMTRVANGVNKLKTVLNNAHFEGRDSFYKGRFWFETYLKSDFDKIAELRLYHCTNTPYIVSESYFNKSLRVPVRASKHKIDKEKLATQKKYSFYGKYKRYSLSSALLASICEALGDGDYNDYIQEIPAVRGQRTIANEIVRLGICIYNKMWSIAYIEIVI